MYEVTSGALCTYFAVGFNPEDERVNPFFMDVSCGGVKKIRVKMDGFISVLSDGLVILYDTSSTRTLGVILKRDIRIKEVLSTKDVNALWANPSLEKSNI